MKRFGFLDLNIINATGANHFSMKCACYTKSFASSNLGETAPAKELPIIKAYHYVVSIPNVIRTFQDVNFHVTFA